MDAGLLATEASSSASSMSAAGAGAADDTFAKAPRRWVVLLAFSLSNALNAFLWIQFAPIALLVSSRFGVSLPAVDWLSLSFMALYVPGALVTIFVTERFGMRALLLGAAAANALAALVRYVGAFAPAAGGASFGVVMLGQCVAALAQPAFINAPSRLAGDWFPERDRAMATTIAAMSNVIGNALGSALPPAYTSAPGEVDAGLLYALVASAIALAANALAITADAPAEPVSAAAARRRLARGALQGEALSVSGSSGGGGGGGGGGVAGETSAVRAAFRAVRADFAALFANRNFWPLFVGFGLGLGIFNALLTLLSQLILPCGYGDDDAGSAGAALLVAGLVGAGVAGALLDRTQAFVPLLQGGIVLEVAAIIFLLSSLRPNAEAALIASFGLVGAFLLPLLPLALENAAETTYPCSEDNSASLMLGLGNVVGLVAVFALEPLIAANTCASVFTPSAGLILAIMAVAAAAICFFRKDYRRTEASRAGGGGAAG